MISCLRHEDFPDCPYALEEVDYEHWVIKAGESMEFAKERADWFCQSVPCLYALEELLKENEGDINGQKPTI